MLLPCHGLIYKKNLLKGKAADRWCGEKKSSRGKKKSIEKKIIKKRNCSYTVNILFKSSSQEKGMPSRKGKGLA